MMRCERGRSRTPSAMACCIIAIASAPVLSALCLAALVVVYAAYSRMAERGRQARLGWAADGGPVASMKSHSA